MLVMLCIAHFTVLAQHTHDDHDHEAHGPTTRNCPSHEILLEQNSDPQTRMARELIERRARTLSNERSSARESVITIPVIVHVIYRTAQENISDAQIASQIAVINEDFRATNSEIGNTPEEFTTSDFRLQFVLDRVTRTQSTRTTWGTRDAMKFASQGGVDVIDPENYLNMWVCNIGNNILGYAQFPGGRAATDGVVMGPQFFGSSDYDTDNNFYLSAPFDKGRTTTHEIGHYLNLRHIWGDGGCNVDDFVTDTPTAARSNGGCPTYPSRSCTNNGGFTSDQFMNFMDYTDDACMYMFTPGQKARVDALFAEGGAREGLGSTSEPTPEECFNVRLALRFDNAPEDISWTIADEDGDVVLSGDNYGSDVSNSWLRVDSCLVAGCYTFEINDSAGDGICCDDGNGRYRITEREEDGSFIRRLARSGGRFGSSQTRNFCLEADESAEARFNGSAARGIGESDIFEVYPNPTADFIIINLPSIEATIKVMSMSGTEVSKATIEGNMIDVSSLSKGMYLLSVSTGEERVVKTFIKK